MHSGLKGSPIFYPVTPTPRYSDTAISMEVFMKKLQILGTGCPKCNDLAAKTEEAAKELGIDYEMVKVSDINDIMSFGVMMTPALAVDGEVKVSGKVPGIDEIKKLIV